MVAGVERSEGDSSTAKASHNDSGSLLVRAITGASAEFVVVSDVALVAVVPEWL